MAGAISLRVPNAAESPPLVESFVGAVARLAGFCAEDAEAVTRASGELACFALEHAYPPGAEGELAVELHLFEEKIVCCSEFSSGLKAFVLDDQARVGGAVEDIA